MLTEKQKALLAFIGRQGRTPAEIAGFGSEATDLEELIAAGYVVLNGTGSDDGSGATGQAPESVLSYALTYAGTLEVPPSDQS